MKIITKATLIKEMKHSVKKIDKENILNSVHDFAKQLRLIIKKKKIINKWRRIYSLNKIYHFVQNFERLSFYKKRRCHIRLENKIEIF